MADEGDKVKVLAVDSPPSSTTSWIPASELLDHVASELVVGQILCTPDFTLHEAMSALELMAPKMDSGMNVTSTRSLDDYLREGDLALELTSAQVIGIMDRLLTCEVLWFQGHTLAQSVFTCLYLHQPGLPLVKDEFLRAYIVAMLRMAENIRNVVMRADVYDEEDFIVSPYGFDLASATSDQEAAALLNKAEEKLQAMQRRPKKGNAAITAESQDGAERDPAAVAALLARIRFRKDLFLAHLALDRPECDRIPTALEHLQALVDPDRVAALRESAALGVVPDNAFLPDFNTRLMGPSPPRASVTLTPDQAIDYVLAYSQNLLRVAEVVQCAGFPQVMEFVQRFSARPASCCLSRSRLLLLCTGRRQVFGGQSIEEFVAETVQTDFAVSEEWVEQAKTMKFFAKFVKPVVSTLAAFCSNRARLRRRLVQVMDDWGALQTEAEVMDAALSSKRKDADPPKFHEMFVAWILNQTLDVMVTFAFSGFELELYGRDEFSVIYWYLDYLLGLQVSNAQEVISHKLRDAQEKAKHAGKGKKKQRARGKKADAGAEMATLRNTMLHILLKEVKQHLCRGLFRFICGLVLHNKLQFPEYPFGSPAARFEQRFQPYLAVAQPNYLDYATYESNTDYKSYKPEDIYKSTTESFTSCLACLDKILTYQPAPPQDLLDDAKMLKRITMGNNIYVQVCLRNAEIAPYDSAKAAKFDFSTSREFPIISVPR